MDTGSSFGSSSYVGDDIGYVSVWVTICCSLLLFAIMSTILYMCTKDSGIRYTRNTVPQNVERKRMTTLLELTGWRKDIENQIADEIVTPQTSIGKQEPYACVIGRV